jgi:hypothetical protein
VTKELRKADLRPRTSDLGPQTSAKARLWSPGLAKGGETLRLRSGRGLGHPATNISLRIIDLRKKRHALPHCTIPGAIVGKSRDFSVRDPPAVAPSLSLLLWQGQGGDFESPLAQTHESPGSHPGPSAELVLNAARHFR